MRVGSRILSQGYFSSFSFSQNQKSRNPHNQARPLDSVVFVSRCIKPNDKKTADLFDQERVMTQLKYTGVLETTRLRKEVSFTAKWKYKFQNVFHKCVYPYDLVFGIVSRVIQSALPSKNSFEGRYIFLPKKLSSYYVFWTNEFAP